MYLKSLERTFSTSKASDKTVREARTSSLKKPENHVWIHTVDGLGAFTATFVSPISRYEL